MAIDRLVLPEPLNLRMRRNNTPRSIGEKIMSMHKKLVVPLKPGRYDITPNFELTEPLAQILTVHKVGDGTLKVTSSNINDTHLAQLANGEPIESDPDEIIVTKVLRISCVLPVLIQTLNGFNNPGESPVVGVVRYGPRNFN